MTLFPVILPVREADPSLSGAEKVARLSRIAREALQLSAQKSGVTLGDLEKDDDDVPYFLKLAATFSLSFSEVPRPR